MGNQISIYNIANRIIKLSGMMQNKKCKRRYRNKNIRFKRVKKLRRNLFSENQKELHMIKFLGVMKTLKLKLSQKIKIY